MISPELAATIIIILILAFLIAGTRYLKKRKKVTS